MSEAVRVSVNFDDPAQVANLLLSAGNGLRMMAAELERANDSPESDFTLSADQVAKYIHALLTSQSMILMALGAQSKARARMVQVPNIGIGRR